MGCFAIIADSTSGMEHGLREQYKIDDYFDGHLIFPDGSEHTASLDWVGISPDEYYASMKTGRNIYKSGAPNPEIVEEKLEKYLQQGRDVLIISLSSAISSTYNMYLVAKKHLKEKYPDRDVVVVDSRRFSTQIAMMNIIASEMRDEGRTVFEVADWIEKNRNRFRQMGPMNDLKFLARTGRITDFKAFFGTLVGVNALGDYAPTGLSMVLGKVKGVNKALKVSLEYIKKTIVEPEKQVVYIGHTLRLAEAERLKEMILNEIPVRGVEIMRIDMICGANIGPGMAAAYYLGTEVSEGLTEETKIIKDIISNL